MAANSIATDKLEAGFTALAESGAYRDYLQFMQKFHHYSWGNIALIKFQRPDATHVAGFKKWLAMGRTVRKGERGIAILVPLMYKKKDAKTGEEVSGIRGFGTGYVFDIASTDGPPVPEYPIRDLTDSIGEAQSVFDKLVDILDAEGVSVSFDDLRGPKGLCGNGYIKIDNALCGTIHAVKTLIHEAAHAFANHLDSIESKTDKEMVAESVAYVVCQNFGLDTGNYTFGYLASYSDRPEVLKRNLDKIQKLAHTIVNKLEVS